MYTCIYKLIELFILLLQKLQAPPIGSDVQDHKNTEEIKPKSEPTLTEQVGLISLNFTRPAIQ